jgi:hypothetical protein
VTVHVGEMHTDVVPTTGTVAATATAGPPGGAVADSEDARWQQARGRTEWLAQRTAAEGFDD